MKLFHHPTALFLLLFLIIGCAAKHQPTRSIEDEKNAILQVIDNETESYYNEDYEAWKSTYVQEPYFRMVGYWEGFQDKVKYHNGFNSLAEEKRKQFEQGTTIWAGAQVERLNINIRAYPQVAWVTFEEDTYDTDTGNIRGKSLQTRILEKHDGAWKIAYLGYHFFPDTLIQN